MKILKQLILLLGLLLLTLATKAQQIRNGGFELHTFSECGINVRNEVFNDEVSFINAFGAQSELDILGPECDFGQAIEGNYFLGAYNRLFSDAFSFELTRPILAGKLYRIRFAARLGSGLFNRFSKIELGLSSNSDEFGTSIFLSPSLDSVWQYYEVQFQATSNQNYVQVRIVSSDETWVFLDDFSFDCPEIDLGRDTALCVVENVNLQIEDIFEAISWNNGQSGPLITVNSPGIYSVLAQEGECMIRDTINIEEIEGNCLCEFYLPNAFSPNGDGFNDEFKPLTDCPVFDYHLKVFGRWGQLVYETRDFNEAWDGEIAGDLLSKGTYFYVFNYRFDYQEDISQESGTLTLVR